MKVGVIARRLTGRRYGIGRYLEYLLRHWDRLAPSADEFRLFVPGPFSDNGLGLSARFKLRVVGSHLRGAAWENLVLPRVSPEVDVLFGPSYTIPLLYRGPAVVATHSLNEAQPEAHPWWYGVTYTPWYRWSAQRADRVIVPSESTRRDVHRYYGVALDRIDIAPEGVDDSFQPVEDAETLRRTREKYFGWNRPYILFVGKMSQRRSIPNLLTAFAELKQRRAIPHGVLLLGPNVLGLPLEQLTARLGIADSVVQIDENFADHRDIIPVYSAADLYAYPSSYDGFSLTLVEALACGTPAVTVNRAALREIAGDCAIMIDEPTVALLTEALERGLFDEPLRARLRAKGLERARTLRWESTARLTLDVLRRVANER
jgi:glycosyltransferase involved in cell wall biosynthesis